MITQKEINRYIKDIKKELLYGTKESRQFLKGLRQSVADFAEENPNAEMAQITEQFGKPEDIAKTYLTDLSGSVGMRKAINKKKVFIVGVVAMLLIWLIFVVAALIDSHIEGPVVIIHGSGIEVEEITTNIQMH